MPSSEGSALPTASELKETALQKAKQIPSAGQLKDAALQKTKEIPSADEAKDIAVEKAKSSLQSLRSLVAGGVGGICAVIVGHPFDLVKVRLQTAEKGVYSGALDVVRKTIAREGMVRVCSGVASTRDRGISWS